MSPVVQYAFVAMVLFVLLETLVGLWYRRRVKYYAGLRKTERIRLQVGDARCRLVTAAATEQLKPTTATFRDLYFIQTSLMRGTDHYPAISEALWIKVLRFEQKQETEMMKEATNWTPEVRAIVDQTADAIRQIWIGYVPFGMFAMVAKHSLVRLGWFSIDQIERWCDGVLKFAIWYVETVTSLLKPISLPIAAIGSAYGRPRARFGTEVKLAVKMRRAELILRNVSRRSVQPKSHSFALIQ